MNKLGSQYYDAADATIDYEWEVVIAFASQACSLYHMLDLCIIGLIALVHRAEPAPLRVIVSYEQRGRSYL